MIPISLETVSGRVIDPSNIDQSQIDIHDIAWSLSRISRFAGHTITETPYNVAQHSVFVADMILDHTHNKKIALMGLLHDAGECYIGDIPSPIKKIPALQEVIVPIEENILDCVYLKYTDAGAYDPGAWVKNMEVVKYFDKKAQFIEAHAYMSSRGINWPGREHYKITFIDLQKFPMPLSSIESYKLFIEKFDALSVTSAPHGI